MDSPNYVLETVEAILIDKKSTGKSKFNKIIKVTSIIIFAVIFVGSFLFQDNLFSELTWSSRILLIVITVYVLLMGKQKENVPSKLHLQFFDDYLVIYRPKCYYSEKSTRMEINKMMYSEITDCLYKTKTNRLHIYGNIICKWYSYDKEGVVSSTPDYDRVVKNSFAYFRTRFAQDIDFVKEIESHSPIKVRVENW